MRGRGHPGTGMGKILNGTATVEIAKVAVSVAAALITVWVFVETRGSKAAAFLGDMDKRVAVIESNRWTIVDAAKSHDEMWRAIRDIKAEIAAMPAEIPEVQAKVGKGEDGAGPVNQPGGLEAPKQL